MIQLCTFSGDGRFNSLMPPIEIRKDQSAVLLLAVFNAKPDGFG